MRLYYVRHGLTDWNAAGRLQGQLDVPLNSVGRAQAAHCGGILRDLFVRDGWPDPAHDYVSSPLVRARSSMEAMRATLGLPAAGYRQEPRLAEISFGEWEGLTYHEVTAREPGVAARREADKWNFRPPGGESYEQLALRVGAWLATVEREAVVCSHGGTGRALVALLGVAPPDEAVHQPIDQGVVYVFEPQRLTRYQ
jgi:broad specificity phosphatase PhoE